MAVLRGIVRGLPILACACAFLLGGCVHEPGGSTESTAAYATSTPAPSVLIAPLAATTPPHTTDAMVQADGSAQKPPPLALHRADVQLYLGVMRSAAERVRHPSAADLASVHATDAWSAQMDAAARQHTRPPAPLAEATLERSANLSGHMADIEIASERGVDLAHYQRIRDTIETIAAWSPSGSGNTASPQPETASVITRDRRLLAPDLPEIRALEAVVRAPQQPIDRPH